MLAPTNWQFSAGIPAGAACFDGHFPGNPIVPGAYLLSLAESRLLTAGWQIATARRIKFLTPLRPDQPFEIEAKPGSAATTLRWCLLDQGIRIAEASVVLRAVRPLGV